MADWALSHIGVTYTLPQTVGASQITKTTADADALWSRYREHGNNRAPDT